VQTAALVIHRTLPATVPIRGNYHRAVRFLGSPVLLRRLALASLVANVAIVVTGGAVRLTGSGLGCPTWPRCTDRSYVPTPERGIHGVIEFGNRTLFGVLGVLAAGALLVALAQRPRDRRTVVLAALVLGGIPAQGVLGGITVLTDLNPWVVGCHFLLSIAVIAVAYRLWRVTVEAPPPRPVPAPMRGLARLTVGVAAAVLVVGTVVTGSGPHAGDAKARRTGLDPGQVAQFHADLVFLLIGLSVALWFALRAVDGPPTARRAVTALIAVELGQGVIGFVQYFTRLPALAVALHMAGACLVWLAALAVLDEVRAPLAGPVPSRRAAPAAALPDGPLPATLARTRAD
jgi:cytochrome c oxidase assembly protein subunit 15